MARKQKRSTTLPRRPRRRRPRRSSRQRAKHVYPNGWKPDDWLVPFEDGEHACIHHGHADPDDHSLCGPSIFCCIKAASLYTEMFPDSAEAHSEWQLTEATHIATWMDDAVNVLYFIFCDPVRPDGLLAVGLGGEYARDVLHDRVLLEQFADRADRLR